MNDPQYFNMRNKTTIKSIIAFLVDNVEELAGQNYSGVTYVPSLGCYRVNYGKVIPLILNSYLVCQLISDMVNETYQQNNHVTCRVVFDKNTGWFSIYKG